ncbi:MAG: hypothetical protein M3Z48_00635 [Lactobacillus sp.]|uniref:hypothetical protein n=1 Tax=Bacillus cereus TaxID=1396 RepID=UPI0010BD47D4|nr:hypothetical protein [Bacillus cereus]MCT6901719.1 hypothetical protein [Lactobacillus sp.]MED3581346.1 hypothetical protein [Bacillus thuringiensis]TKI38060.1 hypothetical protein FC683_05540 [Bacillus cereus]
MNEKRKNIIKPLEDQLRQIDKQINGFKDKMNKIVEMYEDGFIDKDILTSRLNLISEKIENKELLQEELRENDSQPIEYNLVKKLMQNFDEIINDTDNERKKTVLNLVIERININSNGRVDSIILHFDEKARSYVLVDKEDESIIGDLSSFNFSMTL